MNQIITAISDKLLGLDNIECFPEQQKALKTLLERLYNQKECNSVTLVGTKFSSKLLIRKVYDQLKNEKNFGETLTLTLHGLLHADPKQLYTEVERQIGSKLEYNPDEVTVGDFVQKLIVWISKSKSYSSVVFILYEFELFTTSLFQNFLYNILDKSHGTNNPTRSVVPILAIFITRRVDVTELLEKRVRSRLSHQQLHLFPYWSFDVFIDFLKRSLLLSRDDLKTLKFTPNARQWNQSIEALLLNKSIKNCLEKIYCTNKTLEFLCQFLKRLLSYSFVNERTLQLGDFFSCVQDFNMNSMENRLKSLSNLEMNLVLATVDCERKFPDDEYFNFERIFSEYVSHVKSQKVSKITAMQTMQKLEECEIFAPKTTSIDNSLPLMTLYEFKLLRLQLDSNDVINYVLNTQTCSQDLKKWANDIK